MVNMSSLPEIASFLGFKHTGRGEEYLVCLSHDQRCSVVVEMIYLQAKTMCGVVIREVLLLLHMLGWTLCNGELVEVVVVVLSQWWLVVVLISENLIGRVRTRLSSLGFGVNQYKILVLNLLFLSFYILVLTIMHIIYASKHS